ncbi:response regulator transcription factor [Actinocrispum wychmicini]|uniref:Regulatory LuxR family protein n=1 Tax=Actinocrispum wychmicini TaxID=1213861 RepID=A0A4R2JCB2_9PSEU|nr:LuxR C-terminal-related transcriptional regulator [Actinocrispum wychmicini]TCO57183.1 regulatory LuxR family protein [Actinocrispum wychmicini]
MTSPNDRDSILADHELAVLECVAAGMTRPATARHLNRSDDYVKTATRRIFHKLDAANATNAVAKAFQTGLLPRSADDRRRLIDVQRGRLAAQLASSPPQRQSGKDVPR